MTHYTQFFVDANRSVGAEVVCFEVGEFGRLVVDDQWVIELVWGRSVAEQVGGCHRYGVGAVDVLLPRSVGRGGERGAVAADGAFQF